MYLFCLNSFYRASTACPELLQEMPGIALKTRQNRIRATPHGFCAAGAGNPEALWLFFRRHRNSQPRRQPLVRRKPRSHRRARL
jgi:hypothetical protein